MNEGVKVRGPWLFTMVRWMHKLREKAGNTLKGAGALKALTLERRGTLIRRGGWAVQKTRVGARFCSYWMKVDGPKIGQWWCMPVIEVEWVDVGGHSVWQLLNCMAWVL